MKLKINIKKNVFENYDKVFKTMKISIVILFIYTFNLVAGNVHSQNEKLSLKVTNTTIESAIAKIEKENGYVFIYNEDVVPELKKQTSLQAKSENIGDVLDRLFDGTDLAYSIAGKQVVVYKKNNTEKETTTIPTAIHSEQQNQQTGKTITGKVVDVNGEPIIGATIIVQGDATKGTVTDVDGNYTLTNVPDNATLNITYVGMQPQSIALGGRTTINVTLVEDMELLDELVVVGYGTMRKSDLTGSVTRLAANKYENQQMTQFSDLLLGTVAGFNSVQGSSSRGGGSMEIRGRTSLTANDDPLIVLDGVIYNGNIRDISPTDVESIDILKDASSAAVFGARAASGVVIVTTKKGIKGKTTLNFSSVIGISEPTNKHVRPMTGGEYTAFRRDWLIKLRPNQPEYFFHNPQDLPSSISIEEWKNFNHSPNDDPTVEWLNRLLFYPTEQQNYIDGKEENWYKRVIRKGVKQNYNLDVSGGSDDISYYWSIGYNNNEGVIVGDDYSIFRSRLNLNAKITQYLDIGINAHISNQDLSSIPANINTMLMNSPYGSMYEDNGDLKWAPNDYFSLYNPLLNHKLEQNSNKATGLFASIHTNLKLPFGFNYKLSYQPNLNYTHHYNFLSSETPQGLATRGKGSRIESRSYAWMIDNLLTWKKSFGSHSFDFTFLYSLEKDQAWNSSLTSTDYSPTENLSYHALQLGSSLQLSSDDAISTGESLMGRLNYTFKDRYLFTLSIRTDGYSAFGQGNPKSTFPAGAFAWKISDENFYNVPLLDLLKMRVSWGINGNREIGRYAALATLAPSYYSDGSNILIGLTNNKLANLNLSWERTEALNFGIDFGFIGNRINGSLDGYLMNTNQLLMFRSLPRITGFTGITSNLGKIQNKGFELTLNTINLDSHKISWRSNFTFSMNRNKIVNLFGDYEEVEKNGVLIKQEVSDYSNEWFINEAIDRVWDYDITGVWQISEKEQAKRYALTPGDYKADDVNDDGNYSLDDKKFIGWKEPRFRIGLRNELTFFKNWSASIFLRGDFGHIGSISDFKHPNNGSYDRVGSRAVPYWTPENPSNKYGSITAASSAFAGGYNIYFDRSFLRIQDVTISHQITSEHFFINNLRLFASIKNLYSFDKWEGWDPESANSPLPRTYSLGVNLFF